MPRSPLKYSAGWIGDATSCDSRGAEEEMLKHFRRATRVKRAASRWRGAGSEYFNGLLEDKQALQGQLSAEAYGEYAECWLDASSELDFFACAQEVAP